MFAIAEGGGDEGAFGEHVDDGAALSGRELMQFERDFGANALGRQFAVLNIEVGDEFGLNEWHATEHVFDEVLSNVYEAFYPHACLPGLKQELGHDVPGRFG